MLIVDWKDRKAFTTEMKRIYTAHNLDAAKLALDQLVASWGPNYSYAIKSCHQISLPGNNGGN